MFLLLKSERAWKYFVMERKKGRGGFTSDFKEFLSLLDFCDAEEKIFNGFWGPFNSTASVQSL